MTDYSTLIAEARDSLANTTPGEWELHEELMSVVAYDPNTGGCYPVVSVTPDRFSDTDPDLQFVAKCGGDNGLVRRLVDALEECQREQDRIRNRWALIAPVPLPEAYDHDAARQRIRSMTAEAVKQTFVDAGIHNPDGTLSDHYRDSDDESP